MRVVQTFRSCKPRREFYCRSHLAQIILQTGILEKESCRTSIECNCIHTNHFKPGVKPLCFVITYLQSSSKVKAMSLLFFMPRLTLYLYLL